MHVIGLTGQAGCGKSTVAQMLREEYGFVTMKAADPLKDMLWSLLSDSGHTPAENREMLEGSLKEVPVAALGGKTPRYAMQTLGTEWGRNLIWRSLWLNILRHRIDMLPEYSDVVVDDIRFNNEGEFIGYEACSREYAGYVIKIESDRGEHFVHESEEGVVPDHVDYVINNNGTLEDLRYEIVSVMEYIGL